MPKGCCGRASDGNNMHATALTLAKMVNAQICWLGTEPTIVGDCCIFIELIGTDGRARMSDAWLDMSRFRTYIRVFV